ncbi:AMP-binding protein [Nocardioides dubius]|uniref:Fatty-acid--CoA ligase FadD1 n=1 Tax=Nocardioides dubius TaxID=317019 RepID=A0ABP4EA19_9ACTN
METVQRWVRALADEQETGLVYGDDRWSWAQTVGDAAARARVLAEYARAGEPLHVGVLMENTPEMVRALIAGAVGAHVTVGINATRRGEALARDIVHTDVNVVLTDDHHAPLLDGLDLGAITVLNVDDAAWAERAAQADRSVEGFRDATPTDTFVLIFTSGTSGDPKAVKVPHLLATVSAEMLSPNYGLGRDDVFYCAMPLFHSNAIVTSFALALYNAGDLAIVRKFSASGLLGDIRKHGATFMNYIGKPLAYVLATPEQDDDAENPLRVAYGNEATDRDIAEFSRRFGCTVTDGYGSTEGAVFIVRDESTPPGSIGKAVGASTVWNRDTRTECPAATFDATGRVSNLDDAVGELVNPEGGGLFQGYYNDEASTKSRLDGGVYWSGDLAYRDTAGNIFLAGRTDDWLRVDGENLATGPIERLMMRHDAISQAAVYSVPDEFVGDRLMIALVLRDRATLTPAAFETFLDEQADLSPKARPSLVRITEQMPTTATNKVIKRELRAVGTATDDVIWEREPRSTAYTVR